LLPSKFWGVRLQPETPKNAVGVRCEAFFVRLDYRSEITARTLALKDLEEADDL